MFPSHLSGTLVILLLLLSVVHCPLDDTVREEYIHTRLLEGLPLHLYPNEGASEHGERERVGKTTQMYDYSKLT